MKSNKPKQKKKKRKKKEKQNKTKQKTTTINPKVPAHKTKQTNKKRTFS